MQLLVDEACCFLMVLVAVMTIIMRDKLHDCGDTDNDWNPADMDDNDKRHLMLILMVRYMMIQISVKRVTKIIL